MKTTQTVGSKWLVQYAGSTCTVTVEKHWKHYGRVLSVCRVNLNGRDLCQTMNFTAEQLTVSA